MNSEPRVEGRPWTQHLERLRGPGRRRWTTKPSSSLAPVLPLFRKRKGSTFLDIGCGDSGDRIIAARRGFISYGIDLFRPSVRNKEGVILANGISLPFADKSIDAVICHAVLCLLSPDERKACYEEVARVLRPDGIFSTTITPLADGFSAHIDGETPLIARQGLHRQRQGIFKRCRDTCPEHRREFEQLKKSLRSIDDSPEFLYTASILLSLFRLDTKVPETAKFAGVGLSVVQAVKAAAEREGIIDAEGQWHVEWPSAEDDIPFVMDVLAVRGILRRIPTTPEPEIDLGYLVE